MKKFWSMAFWLQRPCSTTPHPHCLSLDDTDVWYFILVYTITLSNAALKYICSITFQGSQNVLQTKWLYAIPWLYPVIPPIPAAITYGELTRGSVPICLLLHRASSNIQGNVIFSSSDHSCSITEVFIFDKLSGIIPICVWNIFTIKL